MSRAALLGAAAGLLLATAPAAAADLPDHRAPNLRPAIDTDEGGLWAVSDKAELKAKASGELNRDPALNAYLKGIVCKVTADYCDDLRVYVLDRPHYNASMAPNGYMEVWSGLLLRVHNEAQLAFVLAHEASHYRDNHSIESWRAAKSRANAAFVVSLIAAGAGIPLVGELAYLGAAASLFSYSRENELEADTEGLGQAIAAGYDGREASKIWQDRIDETAASDFQKVRKQEARTGIFDSHPISAERVKALETIIAASPASGSVGNERYRAVIRPHMAQWLRAELRRKDFGSSLHVIDRLAESGQDLGLLGFYRGEAYRLRRKEGDAALARAAYEEATTHADVPAAVWRELGDSYKAEGDTEKARTAYETYLAKAPDADDRWLAEASLKKLTEGQT